MTEQHDAIRQALEQAEERALERGEPFTERQARALVDRFLSRAEGRRPAKRSTRPQAALDVADLVGAEDLDDVL